VPEIKCLELRTIKMNELIKDYPKVSEINSGNYSGRKP
jgi:hypothetical protein